MNRLHLHLCCIKISVRVRAENLFALCCFYSTSFMAVRKEQGKEVGIQIYLPSEFFKPLKLPFVIQRAQNCAVGGPDRADYSVVF